jgi:hypothetical protein
LGERYIVEQAEPWLTFLSGVLIVVLAIRMFWMLGAAGISMRMTTITIATSAMTTTDITVATTGTTTTRRRRAAM